MKRGDVWTTLDRRDVADPSRLVVIVQEDGFDATNTMTVCAFASEQTDTPLLRLLISPTPRNGLRGASRLMVDKVTTMPRMRLGAQVGRLDDRDVLRLNQALLVFLGLARSPRTKRDIISP